MAQRVVPGPLHWTTVPCAAEMVASLALWAGAVWALAIQQTAAKAHDTTSRRVLTFSRSGRARIRSGVRMSPIADFFPCRRTVILGFGLVGGVLIAVKEIFGRHGPGTPPNESPVLHKVIVFAMSLLLQTIF